MDTAYKLFILLHLLLITNCHGNDLLALLSFKSSISQDPHQALASWNNNSPSYYCNWHGVKCSLRHSSRVIELNLDALDIAGTISPAIANLTFLHRLSISNNRLHGRIPQELGNLRRLRSLNLSMNSLTGEIPSTLSQCSQLKNISLRDNNLQEYGMTNQVSVVGDIYSYGILLLELLTAKRPTDVSFKNNENLHIFVQNAMPEHAIDIIDPFLIFEERGGSVFERIKRQECFTSILKIGLFCSMESPRERMGIEVAIKELHSIRSKFLITEFTDD